ncbi:hypothetical protein COCC4DRAFT_62638 [Bipolaris maydis ATCC 48331]|uniref:Uncharacterized protein n=2 Tax=Cochliobolus heterostrophus TaxID=5016 RepID=M2U1G7_COCH5|nr:uncharacterized protein COCC4DRAFT_62638 [Bipolaris maydis ATCC 48331]EMD87861.1 hypothetical protein COCHEDRAFT_1111599 [Bipolaris maydis C5]ENI03375.1 hypothetical protein COCC4DRAFT_62638 [Bipolaris maydis ATCC 48331]
MYGGIFASRRVGAVPEQPLRRYIGGHTEAIDTHGDENTLQLCIMSDNAGLCVPAHGRSWFNRHHVLGDGAWRLELPAGVQIRCNDPRTTGGWLWSLNGVEGPKQKIITCAVPCARMSIVEMMISSKWL